MAYTEYKVVQITEGGCGSLLFGASKLPLKKIEEILNKEAIYGWQVVFQVIEQKRLLLFWTRESMVVTFGK